MMTRGSMSLRRLLHESMVCSRCSELSMIDDDVGNEPSRGAKIDEQVKTGKSVTAKTAELMLNGRSKQKSRSSCRIKVNRRG